MAKHKQPRLRIFGRAGSPAPPDPRQTGFIAFQAGRFDSAIASWSAPAKDDPVVQTALAEAYFRRALAQLEEARRVSDLERAVALVPQDPRFHYQLALALHRRHDLSGAIERYRHTLQRDPAFPGAGLLLALATLEQQPNADLAALPGSTETIRATLAPVQALLRGEPPRAVGDSPVDRLWQGLGLLRQGDGAAREALEDNRPLPGARAGAVRRYYRGVAAAQAGDLDAALKAWQHVSSDRFAQPWLQRNLATALLHDDQMAVSPNELLATGAAAQRLFQTVASNVALASATVQKLDETAHQAATQGDWTRA
ncbi:MAG TPA: hypothetical protein VHB98_07295, partial [Chloroflexota bacterium]|nr:hypothetical protein [Chloroflexota bacterium]